MPALVCALMTSKRGLQSPWQQPGLNTSYLVTVVERGRLVKKLISGGRGERGEGLAGRWSGSPYQSLRTVAFKCCPHSFHPSRQPEME